jgi:hypothetical protein
LHPEPTLVTTADDLIEAWSRPTRFSSLIFGFKAVLLRIERAARDLAMGPAKLSKADVAAYPTSLAESRTALWSDEQAEEQDHQQGKVQNLRRAVRALNHVLLPAGAVFGFWRQIGRASPGRGYVVGRMLQQGCLVPAVGGGLCQLSNALYDAALQSGCEIVERHAHSRVVPGAAGEQGRDATVAWNYVDLRFRGRRAIVIEAFLERDHLVVRFRGQRDTAAVSPVQPPAAPALWRRIASSCVSCGDTACFRHENRPAVRNRGRTAYLLDECWPEFQSHVRRARGDQDKLGIAFDGRRWGFARHRWETAGFAEVGTAPLETLARSFAARRLKRQGPARLMAQLAASEALAHRLSALLSADVSEACVAQSLLPFLWREGHLGGRGFRVLMTRLPMATLQERLDIAWAANPERASLHDFRAPRSLIEAESEALAGADVIVTPHAEIARLFKDKALLLDWQIPSLAKVARAGARQRRIAFPGPTIARKGAYELREVALALDLEVLLLGGDLERADFWAPVRTRRMPPGADRAAWLGEVAAVVQPALIEDQPRALLAALAAGLPVVATPACGIANVAGLVPVQSADPAGLAIALRAILGS